MIVIDTSALIAMLTREPQGDHCEAMFVREEEILISAGTMVEALIVARQRDISDQMHELLQSSAIKVIEIDAHRALAASDAYSKWGKGVHPAKLNFGDCFSYAIAKEFDCPLLYIGNDFSRTDITTAALTA